MIEMNIKRMPKLLIRHIMEQPLIFIIVGLISAGLVNCASVQKPRLEIPNEPWVQIYFEHEGAASKSINQLTSEAKMQSLRTIELRGDDLEVRIWVGFGLQGVDGLVLRRSSSQWTAIHLHGMADRPPFPASQQHLEPPASGWETLWQKVTAAGILTLPDAASLQCDPAGKDGTSYVVEINTSGTYRTYRYHEPHHANCNEARQMLGIGDILTDELELKEFSLDE